MVQMGRAIGLDVGERRIGVAIADELGLIASPLAVILRRRGDVDEILGLTRDRGADRIIVGLPTGLSGREGPQAAAVRGFVDELRDAADSGLTIEFWDERLTTAVAERVLRERGTRRKQVKGEVDAIAAAVILQGYLDATRARAALHPSPRRHDAL